MTPVLLSFLLLGTIVLCFGLGISLGYWAVCGILYWFNPGRPKRTPTSHSSLATSLTGD